MWDYFCPFLVAFSKKGGFIRQAWLVPLMDLSYAAKHNNVFASHGGAHVVAITSPAPPETQPTDMSVDGEHFLACFQQ